MSRARATLTFILCWTFITGCAGVRLLPGHFGDFQVIEPVPAAAVNGVGESCAATAEAAGRIPAGYRRMPTAIANCTDHPPEDLLDFTLWDGIDTSAQPGYDATWTCWRLQARFRNAALRLAGLSALFGDGRNLPAIHEAVIDHMEEAAALYYWNDGGNFDDAPINGLTPAHADAMADLAVSGRIAYYVFRSTRPVEDSGEASGSPVTVAGVRETIAAQNPAHSIDEAAIERAITSALDRAYTTLWAIRGPIEERRRLRSDLGYIAVAADEDPPHRPLNVFAPSVSPAPPSADGAGPLPDLHVHQQNALVAVPVERSDWSLPPEDRARGRRVTTYVPVDTRYLVIVDAAEELPTRRDPAARFDGGRNLPPHDTVALPEDYDVVLLLHGHSSRAEEAMDLARPLIQEWKGGSRRLAVIAMDLPSNGYSQMIDHRQVADVNSDGGTRISEFLWHDGSFTAYYPTLDFIEEFVVGFVDQLSRVDYPRLPEQIKAVVGGSLGGNLGLRLSRRQRDSGSALPYLRHIVSWSPASTWGDSWARARWCSPILIDCLVTLSESGTYSDIAKHESVRVTRDNYRAYDDGVFSPHGVVERGARKLEYFVNVFTNSGEFFQALLDNEFPPQGDRWYRDGWPCKKTYLKGAILDRWEIYNKTYRLWHWRVAHEQLIFMHNEPYLSSSTLRGTTGADPSYALFSSHLLLAAGSEDNHPPDRLYDNTRNLAVVAEAFHRDRPLPRLTGHTLWLENTGHSIHNERPNLLAQRIWRFLEHLR